MPRTGTPVIVISAIDSPTVRSSAANHGATFMLKPIDLGTFLRTAQRLIAAANAGSPAQV